MLELNEPNKNKSQTMMQFLWHFIKLENLKAIMHFLMSIGVLECIKRDYLLIYLKQTDNDIICM